MSDLERAYEAAEQAMLYDGAEVYKEDVQAGVDAFLAVLGIDPDDLDQSLFRISESNTEEGAHWEWVVPVKGDSQ